MLHHVYASLAEAKQFLRDEGVPWAEGSTNDARALGVLTSCSRRVDDWCDRSAFESGFGPRLGTNRYDGAGKAELDLRDDLLSTSSVTTRATTAAATTGTLTADTDYYLVNERLGYEPGPYRKVILHGEGIAAFGSGRRVTDWAGAWGYEDRRVTFTATADAIADADVTSVTVSGAEEFSVAQTLLIGTEQLFVTAVVTGMSDGTLTVVRGVNGTTAAAHADNSAVDRYLYDSRAVDGTLRLFVKRWRSRTAGADGMDGNSDIGMVVPKESEDTILRRTVGRLRIGVRPVVIG